MLSVEVQNLSHAINNKKILNNINFSLNKDNISCILGPSGSGKTTLLKLIAGLEKVQSGKIIINGEEVSSSSKHLPTEKRKIGFLFQDYALFPHLTVKQNLEYPINYRNSDYKIDDIIDLIKLRAEIYKQIDRQNLACEDYEYALSFNKNPEKIEEIEKLIQEKCKN